MKRGFTLIELLVVIAIIAILASILFPVFSKARQRARQAQCNSNVRQLSLAVQMFAQDNGGQYPGKSWDSDIASYVGNGGAMFQCPEDLQGSNSYAFNGDLVRKDGSGVKENAVSSPSEVAVLADAAPSAGSRLIGGGGSQALDSNGANIEGRHNKGAILGFADGHSKYFAGPFNDMDLGNGAIRAFWGAAHLGMVDNPLGCYTSTTNLNSVVTSSETLTVGGDYNARPLLTAAGQSYGNMFDSQFKGFAGTGIAIKPTRNWVWGKSGAIFAGAPAPGTSAIAYDALCVIVAKNSKCPLLRAKQNEQYPETPAQLKAIMELGYSANTVQVYKMSAAQTSTAQIYATLGMTTWGTDAVEVANDAEMVEKVSNDPYAIGYCSTVFADPERVTICAIDNGTIQYWPRNTNRNRWVLPTVGESSWPWKRAIEVEDSGAAAGDIGSQISAQLKSGGAFMGTLKTGPLFKGNGYWPL